MVIKMGKTITARVSDELYAKIERVRKAMHLSNDSETIRVMLAYFEESQMRVKIMMDQIKKIDEEAD